jgi:UDP-N-acetylglucosamine--N-acetylmuramyl-(pentapeptide) pyrophosphoryl-undecaprenol N-acetylglucosamine transferase
VLVTGGSRGSRTLNHAGKAAWPMLQQSGLAVEMVHQCGREMEAELQAAFQQSGLPGRVTAFLDDMPREVAWADLVICRSGAGAVCELAAAGRAAVLVPYPFAADDHQRHNAQAMVDAGAAVMVADSEMTGERMCAEIRQAAADLPRLRQMAQRARSLAKPRAASRAADLLLELAGGH